MRPSQKYKTLLVNLHIITIRNSSDANNIGLCPPLPGSATPRVHHFQGPPRPCAATPKLRHYVRYPNISPSIITSRLRELHENGKYISFASIEAGLTKIIV